MTNTLRLTFALLFFLSIKAAGQYIPHSGQAFQYAPIYNPAFTGIENFVDVKAGHRYQWTAFKDAAPQFSNLMVNFRVKQPLDLKVNALRPSRTDFTNIIPKSKFSVHGLGFNIYQEKMGPIQNFGLGVHYAIHMPIDEKISVAGGLGVMYQNSKLNSDELYWGVPDPNEPVDPIEEQLKNGNASQSGLWTRAGVLVYADNFYLGATYYPFKADVQTSDIASFTDQFYQGSIQAGVAFPLNEEFDLRPSILALWQVDNSFIIDYNAKFYLEDKAWVGLTYRDIKAGVISGGFNINTMFTASYLFEFAMGKLRTFAGGSHELILAARLKNYKRQNQRLW